MKTQNSTTNLKLGNKKLRDKRRALWCVCVCVGVCGMLGCDQSIKTQNLTTNPKLDNKPS